MAKTNLTLVMAFKTDEGKTTTISLRNIDSTIESAQVKSVMEVVANSRLFTSTAGTAITPHSAQIVEKTNTEFDLA